MGPELFFTGLYSIPGYMQQQRITYLMEQYSKDIATPAELEELNAFIATDRNKALFTELLAGLMEHDKTVAANTSPYAGLAQKVLGIDKGTSLDIAGAGEQHTAVRRMGRKWWAAAAVMLLVSGSAYLWMNHHKNEPPVAAAGKPLPHDVLPGGNKAILTLANGGTIILDSTANGTLAQQGNASVVKLANGQLAYTTAGKETGPVLYNTMTTPRGGQYKIQLPDGTDVWLNAASSITYPTAFTGSERTVTVTGEVYFEVAKDKAKPFHVKVNNLFVDVLGTHFNINSYGDETAVKTTLLEGSVKITAGKENRMLRPGEQAQVAQHRVTVVSNADIDQVMAWKNGLFNFNKLSLQEVLRQLSRWYDVEVVYQGTLTPRKFGGEIQRDLNLSEVLDGLRETGVHFSIDGKKLIVTP